MGARRAAELKSDSSRTVTTVLISSPVGNKPFHIKGVNPATGRVVELTILAPTAHDAKVKAEEAGLGLVFVQPAAADQKDKPLPPVAS